MKRSYIIVMRDRSYQEVYGSLKNVLLYANSNYENKWDFLCKRKLISFKGYGSFPYNDKIGDKVVL